MPTPIAGVPVDERPRERLMTLGAEALGQRELLALVLRHGRKGESALDLAEALLAEYGSLDVLAAARPEELATRGGIGPAKAAALVAAFRLGRLVDVGNEPVKLRGPEDVARSARVELEGARRERVLVLVCDAQNRVRRRVVVGEGAVDRAAFPVREILNAVLRNDGRAFAVAHNHPSGDARPSDRDSEATARLRDAAGAVGLRFLGHVVVAGVGWTEVTPARTPR